MFTFEKILIVATILGSGLIAGVFYGFSTFIMKGLGRIPANEGIMAMQSINITVINPLFLGVFLGTGILCVALVVVSVFNWHGTASVIIVCGSLLYLFGCLAVTMVFNVPLNNALAAMSPDMVESTKIWADYLTNWTFWNHVRTAASLASSAAFITAIVSVR